MTTPLATIDISQEQYEHTFASTFLYSGSYMVGRHQWGPHATDALTGAFKMISPVGKVSSVFQPPIWRQMGEAWGSCTSIGVSPFAPKWVVVVGPMPYPKRCGNVECVPRQYPDEIQVLRLDGPLGAAGLRFAGSIAAPKVPYVNSDVIVDGDIAYCLQSMQGIPPIPKWTKVDLNTLIKLAEDLTTVPPKVLQPDIQGFTYTLAPTGPSPFHTFRATRAGGAPVPPTPTQQADWIEEFCRQGYSAGIGGGLYGPERPVTRREMAVFILKAVHGTNYVPPPCTGDMFQDVICANDPTP